MYRRGAVYQSVHRTIVAGLAFLACQAGQARMPDGQLGIGLMPYLLAATPRSNLPLADLFHYSGGLDLSAWDRYARSALMPAFAGQLGFELHVDLGILADHQHLLLPQSALRIDPLFERRQQWLGLEPARSRLQREYSSPFEGLDRVLLVPSIHGQFGPSSIDVAAVFAQQRYVAWGLGAQYRVNGVVGYSALPAEQAAGAGVRLGFSRELAPGLEVGAAYQSRINMDAFQTYRGVYAEPGDFDIPAAANLGVTLKASDRVKLSFDIERVLYSDISSFTSALLPDRFLSLLGDSSSPEFNWRDLTVFRVGWNWQESEDLSWQLNYSTRQQPTPSSDALARALAAEADENVMSFGFTKRTGRNALLNFVASYSPADYVFGTSTVGRSFDPGDDLLELEVMWVWNF